MDRLSYTLYVENERACRLSLEHFGHLAGAKAFSWRLAEEPIFSDLDAPLGVVGVFTPTHGYIRGVVYGGAVALSQCEAAQLRPELGFIWKALHDERKKSFEQTLKDFENWAHERNMRLIESMKMRN